jgi:hypothetical protein
MVFAGYIRGNAVSLPLFEILDQGVGMRVGVQCDELDQCIVFQDEADELGGLRFIQTAPLDLDALVRPGIPEAQELIEKFLLNG